VVSSSGFTSSMTRDIAITTFFGFFALAAFAFALASAAAFSSSSSSSPKRSRSSSVGFSSFLAGAAAVVGGPPASGLSDF